MKTAFLIPTTGVLCGALIAPYVTLQLSLHLYIWGVFLCFSLMAWFWRGRSLFYWACLICFVCLGFLRADQFKYVASEDVSHHAQGRRISLEGVIDSDPILKVKGKRQILSFVLNAENLVIRKKSQANHAQTRQYFETSGRVQVYVYQSGQTLKYGERVRIYGKLERPRRLKNPGGFDFGNYLEKKGIRSILNAYGKSSIKIISQKEGTGLIHKLHELRMKLEAHFQATFSSDVMPILKAILIGRRAEIPSEIRDHFMKTGTAHLLAISGLHVALVSSFVFLGLLMCGVSQRHAAVAAFIVVLLYLFLSGAAIPVKRASWMAFIALSALWLNREANTMNSFLITVLCFLLMDPSLPRNLSFQLSFVSVLALILMSRNYREEWSWAETLTRTLVIMAGTFPLVAYHFHIFSWVGAITNFFAIPLFHISLVMTLFSLFLGFVPWVGKLVILMTEWSMRLALEWIALCASFDWGYFYVRRPSMMIIVAYYISLSLLWLSLKSKRFRLLQRGRVVFVLCWTLIFLGMIIPIKHPEFSMTLLSAGRNEIIHLQTSGKHWLINTGRSGNSNQPHWIVSPYLRSQAVNQLEGILLLDLKKKHSGGVVSLTHDFQAKNLAYPKDVELHKLSWKEKVPYKTNQLYLDELGSVQYKSGVTISPFRVGESYSLYLKVGERKILVLSSFESYPAEIATKVDLLVLPTIRKVDEEKAIERIRQSNSEKILTSSARSEFLNQINQQELQIIASSWQGAVTVRISRQGDIYFETFLREGYSKDDSRS